MRVGIDFDDVLADLHPLKPIVAERLFGVKIRPEDFRKDFLLERGILGIDQYDEVRRAVYTETEDFDPVQGAIEHILKIDSERRHRLEVVTSRYRRSFGIALKWLVARDLAECFSSIVGVGGDDKSVACRGQGAYIDNDIEKLLPLVGVVPRLFLFTRCYNRHVVPPPSIKRVDSWDEFYREL